MMPRPPTHPQISSASSAANASPQNRNQAAWTRHQAAKIAKLRTTFVKPKLTWPLEGGAHGLHMREMSADEVRARDARHAEGRGAEAAGEDKGSAREGERWYTFEHDAAYRQVQLQFLGAVRSHGEASRSKTASLQEELTSERCEQTQTSCKRCCRCTNGMWTHCCRCQR